MLSGKRPGTRSKKRKIDWEEVSQALHSTTARCVYSLIAGTAVLCLLLMVAITPKRYDLKVGSISPATITASKEVIDEIATRQQQDAAAAAVDPTYIYKEDVSGLVMDDLNAILKQVSSVQQYGQAILDDNCGDDALARKQYKFTPEQIATAKEKLTYITLADYQVETILRASAEDVLEMSENMQAAVENSMNTTIREANVLESIQYLQQIIGYKTDIDLLQNVVTPILRKVVQPNMVIDQEATEKLRQEARDAVEPVVYKQGQNIILSGERVTPNQLTMLKSLGLLDDETIDLSIYAGCVLLVLLSMMVLIIALVLFAPEMFASPKKMLILTLILCITAGVCILEKMVNPYLISILLGVMMLTGLIGPGAGAAGGLALTVLLSALFTGGDAGYTTEIVNLLFTSFISGFLAIILLRRSPGRQQLLFTGLMTALANLLIILTIGFMTSTSIGIVLKHSLWSAAGALISAILCIALDPLFETIFRLATPTKLLELSNPNQPLLRRLLIEASGTYHHSIIVANLSEAAAEAVGANPLLARVGAYFHDIGKLKRPIYFKENQLGENPHDKTNPYISAAIVTAHTRDGLGMAMQDRLPKVIQDIIIEHHGDTPVMYFYHKATQQAGDQPVDIADFRYDGKRPKTKESAIIMLADTVEAAVRSMPDPTPQAIDEFIRKLVNSKIDDGQLRDAPLTLQDIDTICSAFSTVLHGVFHERIEYPSISPTAAAHVAAALPKPEISHVEERELRPIEPEEETAATEADADQPGGEAEEKEAETDDTVLQQEDVPENREDKQ